MSRNDSDYLFSREDLRAILEHQRFALRQEVEQMEANRLLNTSPEDLSRYLIEKYSVTAPTLLKDAWTASEYEIQVDVRVTLTDGSRIGTAQR